MSEASQLIDVDAVRDMADGCGWTLAEFVDLYLDNTRQEMERLRAAVRDDSRTERKRLAHGLAGSSATAGVVGMAKVLRTIEAAAEDADFLALMRAADRRFEAVQTALRRLSDA